MKSAIAATVYLSNLKNQSAPVPNISVEPSTKPFSPILRPSGGQSPSRLFSHRLYTQQFTFRDPSARRHKVVHRHTVD